MTRALRFPRRVRKLAPWSPASHVEKKEKKWDRHLQAAERKKSIKVRKPKSLFRLNG